MIIPVNLKCTGAYAEVTGATGSSGGKLFIMLGARNTLKIKVTTENGTFFSPSDYVSWKVVIDNDYNRAKEPLFVAFDCVDVQNSAIIANLNVDSAALRLAAGDKNAQTPLYCELTGYASGETVPGLTLQFPITLLNRLDLDTIEPTIEDQGNFYNKAQTDALLAAVDTAQVATITKYQPEIARLELSDELGYYRTLTLPGDTVRLLYNVTECVSLALRVRSADPAISGTVAVAIKVNGATVQNAALPVGTAAAWREVLFDGYATGAPTVELVAGLTDGAAPVSVIVDGVRLACKLVADTVGHAERQVAAGPLFYSDAEGYTLRLDNDYSVSLRQPVNGLLAVALRLYSANPEISGDIAVNLFIDNEPVKSAVLPVGASAWQLITLDAPVSGTMKIVRDLTSSGDTLKDGDVVVSAIVEDLNYFYQE